MLPACRPTMKKIIAVDEAWIYAYDLETSDPSEYRAKGEAEPKRSHQSRSKIKVILTVFFNYRGFILKVTKLIWKNR